MLSLVMLSAAALMPEGQQSAVTVPVPVQPVAATLPQEKMICRRVANIGSNIPGRKMCYTKAQWDSLARNSQTMKRSMEQAWTTPNQ